jgi:hypothetical protein
MYDSPHQPLNNDGKRNSLQNTGHWFHFHMADHPRELVEYSHHKSFKCYKFLCADESKYFVSFSFMSIQILIHMYLRPVQQIL